LKIISSDDISQHTFRSPAAFISIYSAAVHDFETFNMFFVYPIFITLLSTHVHAVPVQIHQLDIVSSIPSELEGLIPSSSSFAGSSDSSLGGSSLGSSILGGSSLPSGLTSGLFGRSLANLINTAPLASPITSKPPTSASLNSSALTNATSTLVNGTANTAPGALSNYTSNLPTANSSFSANNTPIVNKLSNIVPTSGAINSSQLTSGAGSAVNKSAGALPGIVSGGTTVLPTVAGGIARDLKSITQTVPNTLSSTINAIPSSASLNSSQLTGAANGTVSSAAGSIPSVSKYTSGLGNIGSTSSASNALNGSIVTPLGSSNTSTGLSSNNSLNTVQLTGAASGAVNGVAGKVPGVISGVTTILPTVSGGIANL
jgi:hypothetical protein